MKQKENVCCLICASIPDDKSELSEVNVNGRMVTMCNWCKKVHEQDLKDKEELEKYICKKHGLFVITKKIETQIEQLKCLDFNYRGILYLTWFCHEMVHNFNPKYAKTIQNVLYTLPRAIKYAEMQRIDIKTFKRDRSN